MSRIGKLPIEIPSDVDVICNESEITVKGKFGTLHNKIPDNLEIQQKDGTLIVVLKNKTRNGNALHGLHRTLISNMIVGVSEQFELNLQLIGVGYRANVQGKLLVLNLGYSHTVDLEIPDTISVEVIQNTNIKVKSYNKEQL
jgi:large subunit ribosomal protein L6